MSILNEIHPAAGKMFSIKELVEQAKTTKQSRVRAAFETAGEKSRYDLLKLYADFYLKNKIPAANETLYAVLTTKSDEYNDSYAVQDDWSLILEPTLIRIYYNFGTKGNKTLEARVEKAILEFLWKKMLYKNDIHQTKQSTWWMVGSENHDINAKACALITSQIFMELPDFSDRVYPDQGCGGGTGYWFHYMYTFMEGNDDSGKGPVGRACIKEAGNYRAKEHFEAWVRYWMEYISERAKKGFFLEVSASGYMKFTLSFLSLIYEFCEDSALKKRAKDFFDLIWAEWAQDQLDGRRGGAKTRHPFGKEINERDAMYQMSAFLLGGEADACDNYYFQLLSDYELPEIIWELVFERENHTPYEYISRKPGEEEPVFPRPLGTERTLLCDTESRLVRYSYVTDEYILGTQMDHPMALHSHLSTTRRNHGVTFSSSPDAYIFPITFQENRENSEPAFIPSGDAMYRSVQYKDILITQQSFGHFQMNPEWFPHPRPQQQRYGIYCGKVFEESLERDGWLFVKDGKAYTAVRPAHGNWVNQGGNIYILEDDYSPVIIHAGTQGEYSTLDTFVEYILGNTLSINDTVAVGYYTVTYTTRDGTELYFNAANNEPPMVNGRYINYAPEKTFSSPYISGSYGNPVVTVTNGDHKLVLDFS
jgi:hypothetical protein